MNPGFFSRENTKTSYIQLDTRKCKACWKCIEGCKKQVIGKVDLPWHKHVLLVNHDLCSGCLSCIKACPHGAFSKNDKSGRNDIGARDRSFRLFLINNLLLFSGIITIFSGLVLQLGYHIGSARQQHQRAEGQNRGFDQMPDVLGMDYPGWANLHKSIVVAFVLLMIYHIYKHYKWYKGVIAKNLLGKNREVIILTIVFLLTSLTGIYPWIINLLANSNTTRLAFIEIHDKLALLMVFLLFLHVIRRRKWFNKSFSTIRKGP
jgi:NAD-dependent dihydropyrimidine dehydrogenase PreA subunit